MDSNTLIAAGGAIVVPVTALLLNYRGFASLERHLEVIERDLKDAYRSVLGIHKDIARLKGDTGFK